MNKRIAKTKPEQQITQKENNEGFWTGEYPLSILLPRR
jgi:hypothetical protein